MLQVYNGRKHNLANHNLEIVQFLENITDFMKESCGPVEIWMWAAFGPRAGLAWSRSFIKDAD